jgi:hypothetical protein
MKLLSYAIVIFALTVTGVCGEEQQQQQQQQCSSDFGATFGPKVHFPDDGNHNDNIREVLMGMGFAPTENAAGVQQRSCMLPCVVVM